MAEEEIVAPIASVEDEIISEDSDSDFNPDDYDESSSSDDDETDGIDESIDVEEIQRVDDLESSGIIESIVLSDYNEPPNDPELWESSIDLKQWIHNIKNANEKWKEQYGCTIDADSSPFHHKRFLQPPNQSPLSLIMGSMVILSAFVFQLMAVIEHTAATAS